MKKQFLVRTAIAVALVLGLVLTITALLEGSGSKISVSWESAAANNIPSPKPKSKVTTAWKVPPVKDVPSLPYRDQLSDEKRQLVYMRDERPKTPICYVLYNDDLYKGSVSAVDCENVQDLVEVVITKDLVKND
jgi:hypothetical protein